MANKLKHILFGAYPKIKKYALNISIFTATTSLRPIKDVRDVLIYLYKEVEESLGLNSVSIYLYKKLADLYDVNVNLFREAYDININLFGDELYEPIPRDVSISLYEDEPQRYMVRVNIVEATTSGNDDDFDPYDPYIYPSCIN